VGTLRTNQSDGVIFAEHGAWFLLAGLVDGSNIDGQ